MGKSKTKLKPLAVESPIINLHGTFHNIPSPHYVMELHSAELDTLRQKVKRLQAVVKAYAEFPNEEQTKELKKGVWCDELVYQMEREIMTAALATLQAGDMWNDPNDITSTQTI